MDLEKLKNHKYLKLIEYALKEKNFSKEQACNASKLAHHEFDIIYRDMFIPHKNQEGEIHPNEVLEWTLSQQAFFNYLQFLEFKSSVESAKKAQITAIVAIIISCALTLSPIVTALINKA
ncbi:hypothetical protein [Kistimonas asteriae]|uniref:hypothetical protein n=1 Tax=Kistimonas asteriae TaxID=517724 RepID=UPI001BAE3319|nr:hypothetical protein [Kistimonas asteriae]